MVIMRLSDRRKMKTTISVPPKVVIAIIVLFASVIPPGQCQSGSTNFLQLFLETADDLYNSSIAMNGISPHCLGDLKIIQIAVDEHSMWTTKCEWSIFFSALSY